MLGLRVGGSGLGVLNGVLLARLIGPSQFGAYAIGISLAGLASVLCILGLPVFVTRETAARVEHGQWAQLKGLLRAIYRLVAISTLAILGLAAVLLVSGVIRTDAGWKIISIIGVLTVVGAFNQMRAALLRGFHWVILADIPDQFVRPTVMLVLIAAMYLTAERVDASGALQMQLLAASVALGIGVWWLLKKRPDEMRAAGREETGLNTLAVALPFLSIAVLTTLEAQTALYLLGYISGSREAGMYQAASQFVAVIVIGLVAVNMPLQPKLAAAWARADRVECQRLLTGTARKGTVVALLGSVLMVFLPGTLLRLYGPGYAEAADAMRILAVGQVFSAGAGSCGILLLMTGHQRVFLQGMIIALVANAAIGELAIPHLGTMGGALSATAGLIIWNSYYVAYAMKKLGLNTTIVGGWKLRSIS